jgi:putative hydrolase of the HAD superfamily
MASLRAVLFDLDGTLTDRSATLRAYVPRFVRDFGAHLRNMDLALIEGELARVDADGYNPRRATDLAELELWTSSPGPTRLADHWREHYAACTRGRAGLHEVLEGLARAGLHIGLVTNGKSAVQQRKIEQLGVRKRISALAISGELGVAKPDPRIFRSALAQLGVEPEDCAFVGDHPENDVLAPTALGMRAIWFRGTVRWPSDAVPARESVTTLAELLPLLMPAEG